MLAFPGASAFAQGTQVVDLSVLIPAYNESKNLAVVLPRMHKALSETGLSYEVLILDTVVPDEATRTVCAENNAHYFNRSPENTYGDAYRSGLKHVNSSHVVIMDADGSHEPEFIAKMLPFRDEYDVVIASRYCKGGGTLTNSKNTAMSKTLNKVYAIAFGLNYSDLSNSFKLYNTELLRSLNLSCKNFDIIEEILVKASRKKRDLKIKEVPYLFQERLHGETKREYVKFIYSYLKTLLVLKFGS